MLFNSVATAALLLRCHSVSQVIVAILLWIGQPSCPNAVCGVNFHPKTMGPMRSGRRRQSQQRQPQPGKLHLFERKLRNIKIGPLNIVFAIPWVGPGGGRSVLFCRHPAFLSTKWLWDHFSSLQNGRAIESGHFMAYKMVVPVNCHL